MYTEREREREYTYVCAHIHIYIYIYIHTHVLTQMYTLSLCIYIYIHIYAYMYIHMHNTYSRPPACICACMHACWLVYSRAGGQACPQAYRHAGVRVRTRMPASALACFRALLRRISVAWHTQVNIWYICMCIYIHTYIYIYIYTYMCTYIHTPGFLRPGCLTA